MKKKTLFTLAALCAFAANSQITKGNWLVGGNARIAKQKQSLASDVKSTNIKIAPNIGYFFIDKFAGGLKTTVDFLQIIQNNNTSKSTTLAIGPFARYYFLPTNNQVNVFAESSYQYTSDLRKNDGYRQNSFSFSAGPVIYFNSSVGLEISLNYEILKPKETSYSVKTLFLGIGLQIHLEKEQN